MSDILQTHLLGSRVETKPRQNYTWDYDSTREPITGVVVTVAVASGIPVLQIRDDDGWIHTLSSFSNLFRVIDRRVLTARQLKVGDVFRFNPPQPGWYTGKLVVVDKHPGWAAPEGYDYVWELPEDLKGAWIELLDEQPPVVSGPTIPEDE